MKTDNNEIKESEVTYTVTEITLLLKISHNKVYDLIREGKLKAFRIGHHGRKDKYNRRPWRIRQSDLIEFIQKGTSN